MITKKIEQHKRVFKKVIFLPIISIIIIWILSYFNWVKISKELINYFIDNIFIVLYISILWVIFSLYINSEEEKYIKNYESQLFTILICITSLISIKFVYTYLT